MAATNACTLQKAPRRRRCCVSLLNQLSTRLSNDALVGVKCPVTLGRHEPADPMCLVGPTRDNRRRGSAPGITARAPSPL